MYIRFTGVAVCRFIVSFVDLIGWAPKEIDYCVGERLSAGDTDEDASPKKRKKKGKQEATADTERT